MSHSELETNEARQGQTGFHVRWILAISVVAAVFAMGLIVGTVI